MSSTAILFPGQGSQSIGMGLDLASEHPVYKETLQEASEVLGRDLLELFENGPAEDLNRTDITQPAILSVSVASWRLLQSQKELTPTYMAGHSLGEYSALVCSGALAFKDAVSLVNKRGEYMTQAVPQGVGAMAAILGLADEEVSAACNDAAEDQIVSPVNFNSPGQVVIAGHKEAVERASAVCQEKGASKVIPLVVSGPFHCALMKPAADQLKETLDTITINSPEVPVINNVDVSIVSEPDQIKEALIRQIYNPVRWLETIQWLESNGTEAYVECGPGKVLAGLNKRINRRSVVHTTNNVATFEKLLEKLS